MQTADEDITHLPECITEAMTSLESDMIRLDNVFTKTEDRRERLIQKLETAIDKIDFDLNGDPEALESKAKAIDTYSRLLVDQENNSYKRVQMKLKKKDTEQQNLNSLEVTDFLCKLASSNTSQTGANMPSYQLTDKEREDLLKDQFDKGCLVIEEFELADDADEVHGLSAILKAEAEEARNKK